MTANQTSIKKLSTSYIYVVVGPETRRRLRTYVVVNDFKSYDAAVCDLLDRAEGSSS